LPHLAERLKLFFFLDASEAIPLVVLLLVIYYCSRWMLCVRLNLFSKLVALSSMLFIEKSFFESFLECREMEKPHQGNGPTKF
jgi:hypothetical protein